MRNQPVKFFVSMLGGREHYAVPRALSRLNRLKGFYTDCWVSPRVAEFLRRSKGKGLQRLAGRNHPDLPSALVRTTSSLWARQLIGRYKIGAGDRFEFYCREGRAFAKSVSSRCRSEVRGDFSDLAFFGFSSASLETLQLFREQGRPAVVDQIDPLRTESRIVEEEREAWPGWEERAALPSSRFISRVEAEWETASHVLVNSPWTASALVEQGVSRDKIIVVPLAYEGPATVQERPLIKNVVSRPLKVLWLGTVNLRKGIPYLIEAAQKCGRNVEVRVVGPIAVKPGMLRSAGSNMTFTGAVPRVRSEEHWSWADVFVLPTLSDGFAITQLEAMARGLPVIATRRCGEVVEDGRSGILIEARDVDGLANALLRLAGNSEELASMSQAALVRVREFSVARYADRLIRRLEVE